MIKLFEDLPFNNLNVFKYTTIQREKQGKL